MLITKVALLSCAFYLGIALAAEVALFALALWKGGSAIFFTWWGWVAWSGAAWLVSTSLAFRLVVSGMRAQLPR
jgi:hypothetical protein